MTLFVPVTYVFIIYVFVYTPVIIDQTFVIFQSPYKIKIHYKTWEKQSKFITIKDKKPKLKECFINQLLLKGSLGL